MRLYQYKDVIGNTASVSLLKNAVEKRAVPKFIILTGVYGTGKSTCAEITGLALTCENPVDGEPCLHCRNCQANLKALKGSGVSDNLVKKNIGLIQGKKDVLDLIREIFVLKSGLGNNVYIVEEFHGIKKEDQTAFLEEIDRLDDNTFVIATTTKSTALLPELRSRAIIFNFSRLSDKETKLLFDTTCSKLGFKASKAVEDMVTRKAKGVPRDLVNMIDFISTTQPTEDMLSEHLGYISNQQYTNLLLNLTQDEITAINSIDEMSQKDVNTVMEQFQEYMKEVMFYVYGGRAGSLSKKDISIIKMLIDKIKLNKIFNIINKVEWDRLNVATLSFMFFRIRQVLLDSSVKEVLTTNTEKASVAVQKAQAQRDEVLQKDKDRINSKTEEMTTDMFMSLFNK